MRNGFLPALPQTGSRSLTYALTVSALTLGGGGCGKKEAVTPAAIAPQTEPTEFFPGTPGVHGEALLAQLKFVKNAENFAPINILTYQLKHRFSVTKKTAEGIATLRFRATGEGNPYFFFNPTLKKAKLDGETVGTARITDPSNINPYLALKANLPAETEHTLELTFTLAASDFNVTSKSGIGFLSSFTDVTNWKFMNRYGAGNFESDQFSMTWDIELIDKAVPHTLRANGKISELEKNRRWRVESPPTFTSSSFFLHFSNEKFTVAQLTYDGLARKIPITLYSKDAARVADAKAQILGLFREIEGDYGPYAHPSFTAYLSGTSGGMEYVGATITSVPSLDHELLHSWFARGVMPAEGRSGWIDEAIASWRDYGYARKTPSLGRAPTNLASYSPFQASTAKNSYADGRALMAELDFLFQPQGGYRTVLRDYFAENAHRVITTEGYLEFIQARTTVNLQPNFDRFVYGLSRASFAGPLEDVPGESAGVETWGETAPPVGFGHPTALTLEEEALLR